MTLLIVNAQDIADQLQAMPRNAKWRIGRDRFHDDRFFADGNNDSTCFDCRAHFFDHWNGRCPKD
jgi:hypothetical protein